MTCGLTLLDFLLAIGILAGTTTRLFLTKNDINAAEYVMVNLGAYGGDTLY